MEDFVEYELICTDNVIQCEGDPDYCPLAAVEQVELEQAHRIAHALLGYRPSFSFHEFRGNGQETLFLPEGAAVAPEARLSLVNIDPETVIAFAEVASAIRCQFVPVDGGPHVPAEPAALMADIFRRASERMRSTNLTLFGAACAKDPSLATSQPDWGQEWPFGCRFLDD